MPITKRGNSWQAAVSHKGRRMRKDFQDRTEAEVWALQTLAALKAGKDLQDGRSVPPVPTLQALLEGPCATHWRTKKAFATLYRNGELVVSWLGPQRLASSLTYQDAVTVRDKVKARGSTDKTANRYLAALSVLVKMATRMGYLEKPFSVGITREAAGRVRYYTEREIADMLAYCAEFQEETLRDFITVALDTGFRKGEILRIVARDVGKANLWTYDTKSGKNREVPLTPRAATVLARRAEGLDPLAPVFAISESTLQDQWATMRAALGYAKDPQYVIHALRHTFVTWLLERGVDVATVRELAGHDTLSTTQRYAHSSPARKVAAIDVLVAHYP